MAIARSKPLPRLGSVAGERFTVMRRGHDVTTRTVAEVTHDDLVGLITGAIQPATRER